MDYDRENPAYSSAVFDDVRSEAEAKAIIVTPEFGLSSEERWARETPAIADAIVSAFNLGRDHHLLDYGCGIGRISREMIARTGCHITGVDISASMRRLAGPYVGSDRFSAISPELLDLLIEDGATWDAAIAIWVLQHCPTPQDDIVRLARSLSPGGDLLVVNDAHHRSIPLEGGHWSLENFDVLPMLCEHFSEVSLSTLPLEATTAEIAKRSFVCHLKRRF